MKGTIDKLAPWASDGGDQVSTPTTAKIARGWNAGEQPPNTWENWKNNRDEIKTNELIDLHDFNCESEFADSIYDRCSGLPNADAVLNPVSAINQVDLAATPIVSICRGYNFEDGIECVFGVSALPSHAGDIAVIQNDATDGSISIAWVETNIPVDAGLVPVDLCCDGHFLYLLYTYDNGGTPQSRLYSVPIGASYTSGVATVYNATYEPSGHAANPIKLVGSTGVAGGKRICIADDTYIAFIDDKNDEVVIVDKHLTTHDSGQGNYISLSGDLTGTGITHVGICSDGLRVWCVYAASDETDYYHVVCAALISNPNTPLAGLTRDWTTEPIYFAQYILDAAYSGVTALVYDGAAVNICGNMDLAGDHKSYVVQFDIASEYLYLPRFEMPSGHTAAGMSNGGATFTGRRLAMVLPMCPIVDLETPDLWTKANKYQQGLALIDTLKGGANTLTYAHWGEQSCDISDAHIIALKPQEVPAVYSRCADVVFADNCVFTLHYYFDADNVVDTVNIIRIPAISER